MLHYLMPYNNWYCSIIDAYCVTMLEPIGNLANAVKLATRTEADWLNYCSDLMPTATLQRPSLTSAWQERERESEWTQCANKWLMSVDKLGSIAGGTRCIFNSPSTSTFREVYGKRMERGEMGGNSKMQMWRLETWISDSVMDTSRRAVALYRAQARAGLSQFVSMFQCPLPTWFVLLRASAHGANCTPNEFIDSCFSFHSGQIAFRYDSHAPLLRPFQVSNSPAAYTASMPAWRRRRPDHVDENNLLGSLFDTTSIRSRLQHHHHHQHQKQRQPRCPLRFWQWCSHIKLSAWAIID